MFWIQALTEVKVINVISTLFMLSRGLSLSQIVYSGIAFSLVTILSEVPSSYLADKWGRKKILILSVIFSLFYWVINIFARGWWLILAIAVYAFANSLMSGTDEALLYDTSKELKTETDSLKQLGQYFSGQRIFKMIMPVVAVLIAKDLSNQQYVYLLLIDVIANIGALFLCFLLKEPKHFMDLETVESGVFKDALKIFKNNKYLLNSVLNKSLMFLTTFMIWRVSSDYFMSFGASVLLIGVTTSIMQIFIFIINQNVTKIFPKVPEAERINILNWLVFLSVFVFLLNHLLWKNITLALITYIIFNVAQVATWPLFSQLFNKVSRSYNRATTLSLANFTKSFLDIPVLLLGSILIDKGYTYLFSWCLMMVLTVLLFFKIGGSSTGGRGQGDVTSGNT
ncbi:MAG: MFS transporter [Candidatus Shapirobacteria bacterium]